MDSTMSTAPRHMPAAPVRAHLLWLASQGVGCRTITDYTGCDEATLFRIRSGQYRRVYARTGEAILAMTPDRADVVANDKPVDGTATRLRYEALVALGYRQSDINAAAGITGRIGGRIARRRALAILDLCRQVGDTPGPSPQAAKQARGKNWRVPADYDEELFYDPHWDGTEPEQVEESPCRSFDYVAEYDHLASAGVPFEDIAVRLKITNGYLQTLLSRRARGASPFGRLSERDERLAG